jgi:hypothetical protein
MAVYGYGNVSDRGFVAFERELEEGAWAEVITKKYEEPAKDNAAALLAAPQPIIWKLCLRSGIGAIVAALGATSLVELDDAWDAAQRRLFHRIALGIDDPDRAVRTVADRLRAGLLSGTGTAQTALGYDDEVDFGRQQLRLTGENGPLAADAKKLKLGDALADIAKTTDALAKGLGRSSGEKRKAPSKLLRDATAECAAAFNSVHEQITWFTSRTPAGPARDNLAALLAPMEALLERSKAPVGAAPAPKPDAPPSPDGPPV